jgi:hypothetical protein
MRICRHHVLRHIAAAAAIVAVAAPAAQAAETSGIGGTSETFTDVREDGSYFGPSLGRRIRVTPRVTIVEPSAFDWGDAGVGAAGAFGLVLLTGGVVIVARNSRRARRDPDAEALARI